MVVVEKSLIFLRSLNMCHLGILSKTCNTTKSSPFQFECQYQSATRVLHEVVRWTHGETYLLAQDPSELVPVELWKEEGNVDITVGARIVFNIRTKEVGGSKRWISYGR